MFTLLNSDHLGLKAVKKNICGCHMPACLPYPMAACGGADGLRPPPFSQHRGDNIFRGLGGTMNGIKKKTVSGVPLVPNINLLKRGGFGNLTTFKRLIMQLHGEFLSAGLRISGSVQWRRMGVKMRQSQ